MKAATVFLSIFGLLWSSLVLVFDVALITSFFQELRTLNFSGTTGKVLASKVVEDRGGDSVSYEAKVTYAYEFEGAEFESSRVKASSFNFSDSGWAETFVEKRPPGSTCPVFVNPGNPSESVLVQGLSDGYPFMVLFLTPFNVAMAGIWYGVWLSRKPPKPLGGAEIRSIGNLLKIRWGTLPPAALAGCALGGASFVGIFLTAFSQGTPWEKAVTLGVWFVAALIAITTWKTHRQRSALTHPDLVIDPQAGTLTILRPFNPRQGNWREYRTWKKAGSPPLVLLLEKIAAVGTAERVVTDSEGEDRTQVVVLQTLGGQGSAGEQDLGSWRDAAEASLFAAWLRETLGVPDITKAQPKPESETGTWENPAWNR